MLYAYTLHAYNNTYSYRVIFYILQGHEGRRRPERQTFSSFTSNSFRILGAKVFALGVSAKSCDSGGRRGPEGEPMKTTWEMQKNKN